MPRVFPFRMSRWRCPSTTARAQRVASRRLWTAPRPAAAAAAAAAAEISPDCPHSVSQLVPHPCLPSHNVVLRSVVLLQLLLSRDGFFFVLQQVLF